MLAVTGANGHLGQRLLSACMHGTGASGRLRAVVRSPRAAEAIRARGFAGAVETVVVDYRDRDAISRALQGCAAVVHLVGVIKESAENRYRDAHEISCSALARAAERAGVERIVYLSILGATAHSSNACLASKGAAEQILLEGPVPATIIRVPMVLGEGDYASQALAGRAHRGFNVLLRGASLEQPIYAGDVIAAIRAALPGSSVGAPVVDAPDAEPHVFDLAGPESLSREALVHRAARVLGRRTRVLSLPLGIGLGAAFLLERALRDPPVTRAMLGVLDHDDRIDPGPALAALGISLTPLDEVLRRCVAEGAGDGATG
jgi:uncharacterized protein YbjT (DUF2867 family)